MPNVKQLPDFVERMKKALIDDLKAIGIDADVDIERIPTTKLFRLTVLAPKFKNLRHSERQGLVWRIAEKTLSWEEQLRISMILTLTEEEAVGD